MTSTTGSLHIATVRQFDPATGIATLVVPGLYGDTAIEARPFLSSPAEAVNLPQLDPGDTVIAFYDGGNPTTLLRWYLTGGHDSGSTGGGGGISTEDAVDAVAAALRQGTGMSIVYNDAANTITFTSSAAGLDTEAVIDAVAAALTEGPGVDINYNDTDGTITINATPNEVWVGPEPPPDTDAEMWFDTNAPTVATGHAMGYVHNQGTAAATWVVTHNLGYYPNVTVEDSGGTTVEGEIVHNSALQLTLTFSAAFGGIAYLS